VGVCVCVCGVSKNSAMFGYPQSVALFNGGFPCECALADSLFFLGISFRGLDLLRVT